MWPVVIVRAARSRVQSQVAAITSAVRKSRTGLLARVGLGGHRPAEVALGDDAGIARVHVDHGQRGDAPVQHRAGGLLEGLVGRDRDDALAERVRDRLLAEFGGEVHSTECACSGAEVKLYPRPGRASVREPA